MPNSSTPAPSNSAEKSVSVSPGAESRGGGDTPAYLRIITVAGLVVMLLGIVGLFWIPTGGPNPAFVKIEGLPAVLPPGVTYELEAHWFDEQGKAQTERGTPAREAGLWSFDRTPDRERVDLLFFRREGDTVERVLTEKTLLLRGDPTTFRLPR